MHGPCILKIFQRGRMICSLRSHRDHYSMPTIFSEKEEEEKKEEGSRRLDLIKFSSGTWFPGKASW